MKLEIKVTKEILSKSMFCAGESDYIQENCAFALAVRDIFPKARIGTLMISAYRS